MSNESLASEILKEVKASAKRWFLAFCFMFILELFTIAGFIWYMYSPVSPKNIQIENTDGYANYVGHDLLGELINGINTSKENTKVSETKEK